MDWTARGDWRIKSENSCLQLKLQFSGKVQLKCESTFLGIFSSITPKPRSPTRGLTYMAKLLPFLRSTFNNIHMQNGDGGRGRWIFPSPDSSLPLELFEHDWSCLGAFVHPLSERLLVRLRSDGVGSETKIIIIKVDFQKVFFSINKLVTLESLD